MRIEAHGLAEAIERMRARSQRIVSLEPALEAFGGDIVWRTDNSFAQQADWDGEPFGALSDVTILNRINAIGSANKYTAKSQKHAKEASHALKNATPQQKAEARKRLVNAGFTSRQANAIINFGHAHEIDASGKYKRITKKLTKAANEKRGKMLAPGGMKILIDTARARNSNHVERPTATAIEWSAVGYLAFHMTGTKRMPMRNPSAFVYEAGKWTLHPIAARLLDSYLTTYILRGEASNTNSGETGGAA